MQFQVKILLMKPILKSDKLRPIYYDIRGPALEEAERLEASGHKIIRLNIGNLAPFGFSPKDEIIQNVIRNLPASAGYSDSKGILPARRAILQDAQQKNIAGVTLDDIYLGNGASELIVIALQALLNAGDSVLLPAPDYPLWTAATHLAGGIPLHYICDEQNGWLPALDDIRAKCQPNTRAIVLINPNNPTGVLYPEEILREIIAFARERELIIFSDEIYDKIIYDHLIHTPTAALSEDILTVTFNGLSKNYCACGYRAGWMVVSGLSNPAARDNARDYIQGLDLLASMRLCPNVPGQYAIQSALSESQSVQALIAPGGALFKQREFASTCLAAIPGVSVVKPQAAFYLFPRLDPTLYPIKNDRHFIAELLRQKQVLVVQGSGFHWPTTDHIRMTFLPNLDDLEEALGRFGDFLAAYRKAPCL
jgi:alanine-synthesizing transaminase